MNHSVATTSFVKDYLFFVGLLLSKVVTEAGETARQFRALSLLQRTWVWVPAPAHLTTICNSRFRGSKALYVPSYTRHALKAHTYIHAGFLTLYKIYIKI